MKTVLALIAITIFSLGGCNSSLLGDPTKTDKGPQASVTVPLIPYGLPKDFFQPGADTQCSDQIIGYRFVVWLDSQNIAVGFNTSPNCRQAPDREVSGSLRILVFDTSGSIKARRDLDYLADGNGEIVADGEGLPGPQGTILIRLESVNLDPQGAHESKSGIRLLNADLKDVLQLDAFLAQTTLVDHEVVIQNGPQSYSTITNLSEAEETPRQADWPMGTMDRKFGETGIAFMLCGQQLAPGKYTRTNVVNVGAKFRCTMNAQEENGTNWTHQLPDGDTAEIIGLLKEDVVGQIFEPNHKLDRLVIWGKSGNQQVLPWLTAPYKGTISSSTPDFSRYASFATNDDHPCNVLTKLLGPQCDESKDGRWFIFDRNLPLPLVDRAFPKNSRAAISPDGLHYASFESNQLKVYILPKKN